MLSGRTAKLRKKGGRMDLKGLLEEAAREALNQIVADGAMRMDVLLVRVRSVLQNRFRSSVPFEMVDAGFRMALNDGRLRLVDGWAARP